MTAESKHAAAGDIDIDAELDGYTDWLTRRGRGRSMPKYRSTVRRYLEDPDGYKRLLVSSRYTPNYRRFLAACAKSWATYAGDTELRDELSDIRLPAPVAQDEREPFDREIWFKIRDEIREAPYLKPGVKAVCSIIAARGIRCGDILRTTRSQIKTALKSGTLTFVSKGEKILRYRVQHFREYLEDLDVLFEDQGFRFAEEPDPTVRFLVCGSGNASAASTAIVRAFSRIAGKLGMGTEEIYAHRFRHTYATHFLQTMHGDPEAVFKLKDQMGWSRLETASNYLRRSRQDELDDIESQLMGDP